MKKVGEWPMNAPNEFINVTVRAGAVAEQLRSSFDPNAPAETSLHLGRIRRILWHADEFAVILEPVFRGNVTERKEI